MKEIWKDIEGYEGLYQVSDQGRVKSLDRTLSVFRNGNYYNKTQKGGILAKQKDTHGYNQVQLHGGTRKQVHSYLVYKLVAKAFIPNPENKPCVDHISTDKNDDRACNLRWVSYKENANNPITLEHYRTMYQKNHPGEPKVEKSNMRERITFY